MDGTFPNSYFSNSASASGLFILPKTGTIVRRLRSLCLWISNATDIIIHQLQNQIESENLLSNYTIKRYKNYIHLQ